ncbi:MAG: head morphogenesis protein [Kofleriaceae bacterium]|nr:head morphogenesis protein [Kofleriaceae bacterium]
MTSPDDILDGRVAADELLAYVLGAPLAKVLDLSTAAGFDRAVAALAGRLRAVAAGDEGRAVREAVAVLDVDWRRTTAAERRRLVDEAMRVAGRHVRVVPTKLDAPLGDAAVEVVSATRTVSRRHHRLAIGVELNALDRRIVRHVTRSHALFVTDTYGRRLDELGQRARQIVASGLEAGRDRADVATELAGMTEATLTGRSRFYWEVVAGAFIGRARSFAQMSSYAEAGIERYRVQAVLDEATTLICRFMHGKVFSVRSAIAGFDRVEQLSDPDDVKRAAPWVRQNGGVLFVEHASGRRELAQIVRSGTGTSDDVGEFRPRLDDSALADLVGQGPPFHGLCRSSSVPVL